MYVVFVFIRLYSPPATPAAWSIALLPICPPRNHPPSWDNSHIHIFNRYTAGWIERGRVEHASNCWEPADRWRCSDVARIRFIGIYIPREFSIHLSFQASPSSLRAYPSFPSCIRLPWYDCMLVWCTTASAQIHQPISVKFIIALIKDASTNNPQAFWRMIKTFDTRNTSRRHKIPSWSVKLWKTLIKIAKLSKSIEKLSLFVYKLIIFGFPDNFQIERNQKHPKGRRREGNWFVALVFRSHDEYRG